MNRKKNFKVCIANSLYYPEKGGGSEKVARLIAESLKQKGLDVCVVTTSRFDSIEIVNGIKVYRVAHRNIYWGARGTEGKTLLKPLWHALSLTNPLLIKIIRGIFSEERPDILHTHNIPSLSYGIWKLAKKMKIKIVHTIHDHSLLCIRANMYKNEKNCSKQCILCKFHSRPKRYLHQYIDFITAPSSYILSRHRQYGFLLHKRVKVVPNPLNIEFETPKVRGGAETKIKFGFMGTLYKAKGIELLIEVFNKLEDAELLIAGEAKTPDYMEYLKSIVSSRNIKFVGYVEARTFFKQIDILIVPSLLNETSPLVIPEAYSYGVPVIASNRGGIPELIDRGITGEVFDPSYQEELLNLVRKFVESPHLITQYSKGAYKKASRFDARKVVDEYIEIFNSLL